MKSEDYLEYVGNQVEGEEGITMNIKGVHGFYRAH